jgi:hypothetical protein
MFFSVLTIVLALNKPGISVNAAYKYNKSSDQPFNLQTPDIAQKVTQTLYIPAHMYIEML